MVQLIAASIGSVNPTVLVHVAGSIAIILLNQCIVKGNLGITDLAVEVGVVETETIGQRQVLERIDVGLYLTAHLLGVNVVVVVLDSPVGVGNAVGGVVGLGSEEGTAGVLHIHDVHVTRHLEQTVDHRSTLEATNSVIVGLGIADA